MFEKVVQNLPNTIGTIKQNGKIPRYLYRLISAERLKTIQQDAFCKATSGDKYLQNKGVFMFDLTNFLKDWGKKIFGDCSLQDALFTEVTIGFDKSDSLVVLKIPTSKLDSQKLKIRSQDVFFNAAQNKPLNVVQSEHLKHGTSAAFAPLYRQRKCPIEYIYEGDIPVDSIEPLGQLNAKELLAINKDATNFNGILPEHLWVCLKTLQKKKLLELILINN